MREVLTQCADNAHQTSPGLTVLCTSSGSWTGAPLCEYDTGYHSVTISGREICQSKLLNTLFRFSPVSQYKSLLIIVRLFLNLPPVLFVKYVLLLIVLNARLVLTLQPVLKLNHLLLVLKLNHLVLILKLNHLVLVLKLNHLVLVLKLNHLLLVLKLNYLLLVLKLNHLLLVLKLNHLLLVLKLNHLLLVLILKHVLNALQILIVQPLMIQLGLRVIPPLNILIRQHWCQ